LHSLIWTIDDIETTSNMFVSEKLTQKLMQELSDALVVASCSLPPWCNELVYKYPCLFSLETRIDYFRATAFGKSRAVVWLQNRRDMIIEQSRGATTVNALPNMAGGRRDDHYPEYRIGRIKHERIKVPRDEDSLFEYAGRVMKFHAPRKSILEIEYIGEEGTGLGPTLEFYALVAAEFQKKALAMWICDDNDEDQSRTLDLGEGVKPPGYYIRRAGGLFPAATPAKTEESKRVSDLFHILGIFLAKVLQDGRLVDLPLSKPFLKLLVAPEVSEYPEVRLNNLLTLDDLEIIAPMRGNVLKALAKFIAGKRAIESNRSLNLLKKKEKLQELKVEINGTFCRVEDLSLTFAVNPSSSVFSYAELELIEKGADTNVTVDNVDSYLDNCIDFFLVDGIRNQIEAMRRGFDLVFPLKSLRLFTAEEVQKLLSGEQYPEWTREDVMNYTEPKLGYTKDSPGFLRFVDVLVGMNASERKSFLQFTTGCSSLPPGY
uniref:E3 ubiquitin-protein ligase n=1 Tax=Dracunculus medinensis TaxID=318479 RepID=A0A0N4U4Z7_DRAME